MYVTSDLHLGSRYCLCREFIDFLGSLPEDAELVLNGDSVDRWNRGLPPLHAGALDALRRESHRRRVIWVRGNHDEQFELKDPAGIVVEDNSWSLGRKLYIAHGYDFDNVMPKNRMFIRLFRAFHHLRIALGAQSVHVAHYAKKFHLLYDVLIRHVRANAIEYARENGYEAVTCGHTHYAEDVTVDGVRYVNTGSWTERPVRCLHVTDTAMELVRVVE